MTTSEVGLRTDGSGRDGGASGLRIVLVESHAIMREGLKRLIELQAEFSIAGDFGCVEQCLSGIRDISPNVIVTDLVFPGQSGIELLAQVQRLSPLTRKLVLTEHRNESHVRAALGAGADGYVLKDCTSAELMLALRTVAAGQQFLCKAVADKVLSNYLSRDGRSTNPAIAQPITERERAVLTYIALGNSNKLIARELGVSPKTIEKHRSNLMRKLQLRNVAAVTMYAIRNGMTSVEYLGRGGFAPAHA
ncbi:MAG: Transcriptional regulatory protein DegU [Gammaproteobacteria bacterium]|nr:Transcriptional regulatory protein DegU [Gammaproteobacteria bacterium]